MVLSNCDYSRAMTIKDVAFGCQANAILNLVAINVSS